MLERDKCYHKISIFVVFVEFFYIIIMYIC